MRLTERHSALLRAQYWEEFAGSAPALWVSVAEQRIRLVAHDEVVWDALCSTALNGVGCEKDSYKTPVGWHAIAEKIGDGAPWGQVFKARQATERVWAPSEHTDEDLIASRILVLDGLEKGVNCGGEVDTRSRYVYIHGTNHESRIGEAVSHGCVRLRNDDAITLFGRVEVGTRVLITVE